MARGVTPDGIYPSNRVENTSRRVLAAKVVDNILNSATLASRHMGMGKSFQGSTKDITVKITDGGQGQWVGGMEVLSKAATDTTVTLSYAHTAFEQPVVLPMLESFANVGEGQEIDLDQFKIDEAKREALSTIGSAWYGLGTGDQMLGLGAIVDDGTDVASIGGQSRSTYTTLNATRTASGGTLSLSKLATLHDNVSDAGGGDEEPTIHVTTKAAWSLYEQLLNPQVRAEYQSVGYDALPVRAMATTKKADLKGGAGFTALTYRGIPVIKDEKCPSGEWFMLNENYMGWYGRTMVPPKFKSHISKVSLGKPSTIEGVAAMPSNDHGWFLQEMQMMPDQAGMIGRFWIIGNLCVSQPRRQGRLTGINSV